MPSQLAPVDLQTIQRPLRHELDAVFEELRSIIASDLPGIAAVNEHLLRMKGKMFRSTLLLLSGRAAQAEGSRQVTLAAVTELIHLATLVHDDSVDHSVLRRGQPTINALFSHQTAVIMGDYLYSRAIIQLVDLDDPEPLRVMSRVTNEMTIGEMRELMAYDVLDYSEDDYDQLICSKTASLFSGACDLGALGAPADVGEALRRYGLLLGMAFQIADDVLDYTETESVTGKPSGLDLREHKITLPLIAALPNMMPDEHRLVEELMDDPTPSDDLIAEVVSIVERRGGVTQARERASEFVRDAEEELRVLPEGSGRDALRDCLSYAIDRRR